MVPAKLLTALSYCVAVAAGARNVCMLQGYSNAQFIKPKPNNRSDEYGGSIEKRCRFCLEVVQAVTDEVGAENVGIRYHL